MKSQPWSFPRSLMVGFQANAAALVEGVEMEVESSGGDRDGTEMVILPGININEIEMENIQ